MADRYKSVLLFGTPGVGKGTQGKILGAIGGFYHCASGDIFRSIDKDTELGQIFYEYSSRGELVPDDVTVKMWESFVRAQIDGGAYKPAGDLLILDGIPRTVEQTRIMDGLIDVLKVIDLTADDREAMFDRLRCRVLKEHRYDDADENVIRNRWLVYERETAPVLAHYPSDVIVEVNAVGTQAQVLGRILKVVEPVQTGHFDSG